MSQRWQAVGNTVSDLAYPRFEPQTSCFKDERVSARPTGRLNHFSSDGQRYVSMAAALNRIFIAKLFFSKKSTYEVMQFTQFII